MSNLTKPTTPATVSKNTQPELYENIDTGAIEKRLGGAALFTGVEQFNLNQSQEQTQEKFSPLTSEALKPPMQGKDASKSFLDMLQKLGVPTEGIALNDIGKAQLMARLEKILGPDYMKNTGALDAISAFDTELLKYPMDTKKSLTKMVSNGNRTLKELLKG